ncbi:MAG TPA: nucleoside-diphosphate sugar epimerase/dehydratase [Burkholderiales bacterium]|nr:nucleoside-diphosphate sugar epimerase/dehydratase [Burkholderiales bacterium]
MNWRTLLAFAHDMAACALAWLAAFWLRFNFYIPPLYADLAVHTVLWVVAIHVPIFIGFNLYRGIWRFASLHDLRRIILAVFVATLAVAATMLMLEVRPPRSVFVITPVFLITLMGGSRFVYRLWRERAFAPSQDIERTPVLVLGAEDTAVNLIKELVRSPQWRVVGTLAEDGTKYGRELHGVKVLGPVDAIGTQAKAFGVKHAIVAMPESPHAVRRQAIELARSAGLQVLTVPSFDDLMSGKVTVSQVRNVELDDLLGRDPVVLDTAGLKHWINNNVVLVSGAGGSIGSELCRQIARYHPRELILLELNEFALYEIEQEFSGRFPDVKVVCAIGDVKNLGRVSEILAAHHPAVVFHAAAYKHVPLMETGNAWQAVLNNVLGTLVLARAAIASGVEKFVFISTDKAVNPTNVMGASKRLAEMVCQSLQQEAGTRFVMVRFGNVLGSTGSVIPKFREQIANGGPVTVTHPDITRYFMSIPEAVQLVLQAGLMGQGGEIFVLDMGEPVRITDLARDLIKLSGYTENEIRIVYTGLRPGEKLFEETLATGENTLPTPHPKLHVAQARRESTGWLDELSGWLTSNPSTEFTAVKAELARRVPEYTPQQTHGA